MATKKISEFLPGVQVKDEGSNLTLTPTSIDFTGSGVTATQSSNAVTVNIPGGGTPGGSTTQVQYNNAGAFAGSSNLTFNGTVLSMGGGFATAYGSQFLKNGSDATAGGTLTLQKSTSNNSISGSNAVIGLYGDAIRIFEESSPYNGIQIPWKRGSGSGGGISATAVPLVAPNTPANGDISVSGSVVSMYANSAWRVVNTIVQDEGVTLTSGVSTLNFVGAGVTATNTGDSVTITIPGGAGGLDALSDVIITTPSNGQVLKYNGTNWVNDADATGGGGAGFYYQATAPSTPTAGDRWVNSSTGIEYTYVNDGTSSQWIELGAGNGISFYYQASAPASAAPGDKWVDSDTGIEYTYINDGNSTQWIELGGKSSQSSSGGSLNIGLALMLQSPNTLFY